MTNEEFILQHRGDDVRKLALQRKPDDIDLAWCLQQIEGWQMAQRKLPQWAAINGLHYPQRLSMEQCSSEQTALYKRQLCQRLGRGTRFADLTGGFGIDFSYMAVAYDHATYVERSEHLCQIAHHNFPLLGLSHADIVCTEAEEWVQRIMSNHDSRDEAHRPFDLIFLDPARRDNAGRKVAALEDCTPNVLRLQDDLLQLAHCLVLKLSPMLDIHQALRSLHGVEEVHIVSAQGECKELLVVITSSPSPLKSEISNTCATENAASSAGHSLRLVCVNLGTSDSDFVCSAAELSKKAALADGELVGSTICEPNASILKAGVQDVLACQRGWMKLHPNSNLFVLPERAESYGRLFRVEAVCDFSKRGMKAVQEWVVSKSAVARANLTLRNFPGTVENLRKRLRIQEGGDAYIFATTLNDDRHVLLCCKKITQ